MSEYSNRRRCLVWQTEPIRNRLALAYPNPASKLYSYPLVRQWITGSMTVRCDLIFHRPTLDSRLREVPGHCLDRYRPYSGS